MGTAFGILHLAVGIALFWASFLAGSLWQKIGSEAAFIAGSLLTGISAIVLLAGKLLSLLAKPDLIEVEGVEAKS